MNLPVLLSLSQYLQGVILAGTALSVCVCYSYVRKGTSVLFHRL